jgi:predicted Abi (CAAX) family protease
MTRRQHPGPARLRGAWLPLFLAVLLVLALLAGLAVGWAEAGTARSPAVGTPTHPLASSSEALAARSSWSRPQSYPLTLRPPADLYRPSAEWIGRLILPAPAETGPPDAPGGDWVWIEIEQAPAARQALIGQRLPLQWAERPELRRLVETVTTTIRLGEEARQAAAEANVVPSRLDGRRVGPLQSLAGARPRDDVTVALEDVELAGEAPAGAVLRIASPPLQITGRWQTLVTLVGRADGEDLWRVRHRNPLTARFDGREETIRIPALPPDRFGRRLIDPAGLLASPLNGSGWLIQGAPATDGVFTAQALLPYRLLEIRPGERVRGTDPALAYVRHDSWRSPLQRGALRSTALVPDGETPPPWSLGERALLMHLFGGIGGEDGEPVAGWTVTGHFAFGEAQVVRDAFTGRPRLAIRYHQIYANNPNGIVAGSQDWSAYAGSLQRGWIGLRPFSDILVPMGEEVLDAIGLQAELLAARYRSGDGSGVALVTPSTSCVQDSAQALWIAIQQLRLEPGSGGMAEGDRQRLRELGLAFDRLLEPFGRVRSDWRRNAASALAVGTGSGRSGTALGDDGDPFAASQRLQDALLSWRSLLPRSAHDLFAAEFLRVGLPLLALRTDQIPGADPRLAPLAPTALFGQLPGVSVLLGRLGDGLFPLGQPEGHLGAALVAGLYGAGALTLGRPSGLRPGALPWGWRGSALCRWLLRALRRLVAPAFLEELLFRGLLLPSALDGVRPLAMLPWMALSTGLFVLWHHLAARCTPSRVRGRRRNVRLLLPSAFLGMACCLVYVLSGSLWWPVLLHWVAAMGWSEGLGGGRAEPGAIAPQQARQRSC